MLYLPEVTATSARSTFAVGITAGWLAAGIDVLRSRQLSLGAYVGVYAGALHAVVLRGDPSAPGDQPWGAAMLAVRFRALVFGPLALEAGVEGVAPLVRHRFFDGNHGETVFQQGAVAASAFVGVGLQFR